MKRTREHPFGVPPASRLGISSMMFFDGEDLGYKERRQAVRQTQN
jgi:hypothetical protein